jgi:hypothetical protein
MLKKFALVAFAALVCSAVPASAQGLRIDGDGVRIGRSHHGERDFRRSRGEVMMRRDRHRDYDRRRHGRNRTVIIER